MAEPPLKFQFGAKGNVRTEETYDTPRGYGFEPTEGDAPWTRFSVRGPEGNYRVTVHRGAGDGAAQSSVAAVRGRGMVESVAAPRGECVVRSFSVGVRVASLS